MRFRWQSWKAWGRRAPMRRFCLRKWSDWNRSLTFCGLIWAKSSIVGSAGDAKQFIGTLMIERHGYVVHRAEARTRGKSPNSYSVLARNDHGTQTNTTRQPNRPNIRPLDRSASKPSAKRSDANMDMRLPLRFRATCIRLRLTGRTVA